MNKMKPSMEGGKQSCSDTGVAGGDEEKRTKKATITITHNT